MNKQVAIENFKCFAKRQEFSLGKITAFAGMNSVGKSSIIQSLLLVRQIRDAAYMYRGTKNKDYKIELNGVYGLQLGDSQRIKSSRDKDDIALKVDDLEFRLLSNMDQPIQLLTNCRYALEDLEKSGGIFADAFYYLNAERLGPRNYQNINSSDQNGCGIHGENTFHFVNQHVHDKIDVEKFFPGDDGKRVNTVSKQIEYWMDYMIPGVELDIRDLNDLGISRLDVRQQVFDTGFLSPYNFGFGISYILPIVVTGLLAEKDSMMIVENPEAHLHPCGQSRMGFFLTMMAMAGVQVVLETHSEHVINGMRIAALKQGVAPEDIRINFFSIDYESGDHMVNPIELNDNMDLMEWPKGFLDQEENDLRTLRELRRKR